MDDCHGARNGRAVQDATAGAKAAANGAVEGSGRAWRTGRRCADGGRGVRETLVSEPDIPAAHDGIATHRTAKRNRPPAQAALKRKSLLPKPLVMALE